MLHVLRPPEAGTAAPAVPAAAPADEDDEATEDNADDPEDEDAATFLLALREPGADPAPKSNSKTKKAPPVAIAWAGRRRRTGLAGAPTSTSAKGKAPRGGKGKAGAGPSGPSGAGGAAAEFPQTTQVPTRGRAGR